MTMTTDEQRVDLSAPNWIWDLLICPECGAPLRADDGQLRCAGADCGFSSTYAGRVFNLLPRDLDRFQRAEDSWRTRHFDQLRKTVPQMSAVQYERFKLLNVITYYAFTSQFFFFRDYFAKTHTLRGRGLEIGGASGQLSGFVKMFYPGTEMIATDVAPINVEMGAELAGLLRFETDYLATVDAERLPFRPESFDFLCSSGMLHHLGDMRRALRQGRTVLKPGGRWYVVNELAIGSLPRRFWNSGLGAKGKWAETTGIRENSYTLGEWRAFFAGEGFRIVDTYFNRNPGQKLLSWPRSLYYAAIAKLPLALVKAGIPCEVNFVLEKQ
ncbi:methyltransferase domain-containing protein [Oscillochloris sp. ZM17-4]|uniref:methyltransferase domain-containing protein n=1 Tax=Oscillochloris sp. ZM17-4 TaxID=2866714 RepID=UPI001C7304D8|nr:methyltransferase domain-containing protein [Oscillochloris sp. ZM17-4]MBX0327756.1 methyltransferase domain-containing protein [Oscillochloris sp. ZM17-4]